MKIKNVFFNFMLFALVALPANAAVVERQSANVASRASISRMPTIAKTVANTQTVTNEDTDSQTTKEIAEPATVEPEPIIIENKSNQFDTSLNNALTTNIDESANDLAAQVRAQRAALDAASNASANASIRSSSTAAKNACDMGLRNCMTEKCGNNFAKCASDTDTLFGTKLDACRNNLKCSANEFKLFSAEIKSDRALNIKLKAFNDIITCGQDYDTCIIEQCGTSYSKCLGKSAGDTAISKCVSIANRCNAMDNGLANRTMNVFATLRQTAEKQISSDEKKLYALRDQMKSVCSRMGAMFDERSLDCVYTVNFYAGDDSTLYSSKKAYAGSTFSCTPNWFGIDVTTFKENAYRLTRAQSSASSAMLGSGVGMAVGSITSGAIDRAIERHNAEKADKALEKAEKEVKNEVNNETSDEDVDEVIDEPQSEQLPTIEVDEEAMKSLKENLKTTKNAKLESGVELPELHITQKNLTNKSGSQSTISGISVEKVSPDTPKQISNPEEKVVSRPKPVINNE